MAEEVDSRSLTEINLLSTRCVYKLLYCQKIYLHGRRPVNQVRIKVPSLIRDKTVS